MAKAKRKPGRIGRRPQGLPAIYKTVAPDWEYLMLVGPHLSLAACHEGAGDDEYALTLVHAIGMGLELRYVVCGGQDIDDVLADGMAALARLYARGEWKPDPGEYDAIREALTIADAIVELSTNREIVLASRVVGTMQINVTRPPE